MGESPLPQFQLFQSISDEERNVHNESPCLGLTESS
jgi:hypothetical protein